MRVFVNVWWCAVIRPLILRRMCGTTAIVDAMPSPSIHVCQDTIATIRPNPLLYYYTNLEPKAALRLVINVLETDALARHAWLSLAWLARAAVLLVV